ncbi:MAG: hypothetical protein NTV51_18860 [Verrucomicrobia bacterium]|nr:hypothetical protein [Verrucomicrobiota bacterium]
MTASPAPPAPSAPPAPREQLLRWLLALGAIATLVFFFSPSWAAFHLWSRVPELSGMIEVRRGVSVLEQVASPGTAVSDPLHAAIQWRLLFPALGHFLGLPPFAVFALAHVGAGLVLAFLVTLLRRARFTWADTALATVALGAASWFFTSTGWLGYYDSWLALGLLLVAFADARWAVWLACLWAPWVDERFLLAAPLALGCRWLHRPDRFDVRREVAVPAALLLAYAGLRFGLLSGRTAAGATAGGYLTGKNFLDAPLSRIALGVWDGLRSAWALAAAAVIVLWPQRARALLLAVASLALLALGLATAQDYSRSMTMLLPVAVLGVLLAAAAPWLPRLLRIAVPLTLLLPAHHVMNDRVNPIFYLYHELAALDTPPPLAMSELYELRAIHAMERGEFAAAQSDLALAIRLAANPASPAKQRGILAASQQRWADAHRDFSLMVEHDAKNPDAWFMRAQANQALGKSADARADFEHARSLAPADWPTRPDVARFLARLNAPSGGK